MRPLKLLEPAAAAAVVIALSTLLVAQRPDSSSPSGKDFGIVGGNVFNHRYSSLSRINKNTTAIVITFPNMANSTGGPPQAVPVPSSLGEFIAGWTLSPEQTTHLRQLAAVF